VQLGRVCTLGGPLGRLAWSQLRFRAARALALLAGILLAATAFMVLTAASRTSQLRTVGTVASHFSPAYDILVRPKGSRTALSATMFDSTDCIWRYQWQH
jgi:hypothetical protein